MAADPAMLKAYDDAMAALVDAVPPDNNLRSGSGSGADTDLYVNELLKEIKKWSEGATEAAEELIKEYGSVSQDDIKLSGDLGDDDGADVRNDDDDGTLKQPRTLSTDFYGIGDVVASIDSMTEWLRGLPGACAESESTEKLGYTKHHCAFYLFKGVSVMQRVSKEIEEGNKASATPKWVSAFASRSAPVAKVVQGMFAAFLYTAALRNCTAGCINPDACKGKKKEDKAAGNPSHLGYCQPENTRLHGWNTSLWSVMNWDMRLADDETIKKEEADAATVSTTLRLFRPMIACLDWYIANVPHERRVVFRGIKVRVSHKYRTGTIVVWPAFSSTSLDYTVAKSYMGAAGTFFIAHAHSASMIDYLSEFTHEKEALLMSNRKFRVTNKVSRTVLQMLGCAWDIVHMTEIGSEPSPKEAIEALYEAQLHVLPMYEGYVNRYVEARVAPFPGASAAVSSGLYDAVAKLVGDDTQRAMLLLGSAGCGKTSAALACMSYLGSGRATKRLSGSKSSAQIITSFIPLTAVDALHTKGAIDRAICSALSVTEDALRKIVTEFTSSYSLVVVLDSLDEISVSEDVSLSECILGLLDEDRNPLAAQAKIIVSSRNEFLGTLSVNPPELVLKSTKSDACSVSYIQAFSSDDVHAFVRKQVASEHYDEKTAQRLVRREEDDDETANDEELKKKAEALEKATEERLVEVDQMDLAEQSLLTTPMTLKMLNSVLAAPTGKDLLLKSSNQVSRSGLYGAYLQLFLVKAGASEADVDAFLAIYRQIALEMLKTKRWRLTMAELTALTEASLSGVKVPAPTFVEKYMPCRVEDANDETSAVEWSHKSIGEFVAATAIFNDPKESITKVERAFSVDTPQVLQMFSDIANESDESFLRLRDSIYPDTLKPMILATKGAKGAAALANGSNALALACCARLMLRGSDFSGIFITEANLNGAKLYDINFSKASFDRCVLDNIMFDKSDFSGLALKGCRGELPHPPIERPDQRYRSASVMPMKDPNGTRPKFYIHARFAFHMKIYRFTGGEGGDGCQSAKYHTQLPPVEKSPTTAIRFLPSADDEPDMKIVVGVESGLVTLFTVGKESKEVKQQWQVGDKSAGPITSVSVDDLGNAILVTQKNAAPFMLNPDDGNEVARFDGVKPGELSRGCISGDGEYVAFSGVKSLVFKKDKTKVSEITTDAPSVCVAWSIVNKTIAFGCSDGVILVLDKDTDFNQNRHFNASNVAVTSIGFIIKAAGAKPEEAWILAGCADGALTGYYSTTFKAIRRLDEFGAVEDMHCARGVCNVFIVASSDDTANVWNNSSGIRRTNVNNKDRDGVSCVVAVPDHPSQLIVASNTGDQGLVLRDFAEPDKVVKVAKQASTILLVAVCPERTKLVTIDYQKAVKVWSIPGLDHLATVTMAEVVVACAFQNPRTLVLSTGKQLFWFEVPSATSGEVATVAETKRVATLEIEDNMNHIAPNRLSEATMVLAGCRKVVWFNGEDDTTVVSETSHDKDITCLSMSNDEKFALSCGGYCAHIWNTTTKAKANVIKGPAEILTGIYDREGTKVILGNLERTVTVHDASTAALLFQVEIHRRGVTALAMANDNTTILSGSADFRVHASDPGSVSPPQAIQGHSGPVLRIQFSPDSRSLFTTGEDGYLRVWSTVSGGECDRINVRHGNTVAAVAVSKSGSFVVCGTTRGDIVALPFDQKTRNLNQRGKVVFLADAWLSLTAIDVSPTETVGARVDAKGTLQMFGIELGEAPKTVKSIKAGEKAELGTFMYAVSFNCDGSLVAAGGKDNSANVYNVKELTLLRKIKIHGSFIYRLQFDYGLPNILYTAGADVHVNITDVSKADNQNLTKHWTGTDWVFSCHSAPHPDKKRSVMITTSRNRETIVWDVTKCRLGQQAWLANKSKLLVQSVHDNQVKDVRSSPDGTLLATSSLDGSVRVSDFITGEVQLIIRRTERMSCKNVRGALLETSGSETQREASLRWLLAQPF